MSDIREQITQEMKIAMKAKDSLRLGTLRMVKAEIIKKETEAKASNLTSDDLLKLLQTMKKQRLDSITQFEKGGRQDLADKERAEIGVLESFLPKPLSDEELTQLVAATADEHGIDNMKQMGQLIKAVMAKAVGQVDGKRVSSAVRTFLGQ